MMEFLEVAAAVLLVALLLVVLVMAVFTLYLLIQSLRLDKEVENYWRNVRDSLLRIGTSEEGDADGEPAERE